MNEGGDAEANPEAPVEEAPVVAADAKSNKSK